MGLNPVGPSADFRILGPLEVSSGDRRLDLGGAKQRELLALLLLRLNEFVPASRLADALWRGNPPPSAAITLRTHVSHLRRRLSEVGCAAALVTRPSGYGLVLDPEHVDAHRFERLLWQGQEALGLGEAERAADRLAAALHEWRGPLLDDLGDPPFAISAAARLDELRLVALERRMDADLALGRDVVPELEHLVEAYPFRERFCGQLMVALYRAGRQVEALAAYSALRRRLADELGLDVGPPLADLETAILRHAPSLLPDSPLPAAVPLKPEGVALPDALFASVAGVPMVARSGELARLEAAWATTRAGAGRVVLVSGEAGVGKTRLVAEFAKRAVQDGGIVLVGRCDPLAALPYQPMLTSIDSSAEAAAVLADAPEAVRARFDRLHEGGEREMNGMDEAADRLALQRAFEWVLAQLAGSRSTVVVVEDAERIDWASALLLRHLVAHLAGRLLLLVSYRDPPGSRHAPLMELLGDIAGSGVVERLALRPLGERALAELVEGRTGEAAPDRFVRELWEHTGGNPYFATEVLRDIGDGSPGRWRVPAGVQDVLRHRLLGLPEPAQQVVRAAAVIGREVEFGLLSDMVELGEDQVIDSVEQAIAAGFLIEAGRSWMGSYEFAHELTREAVHADVPLARRQRLHLRAAQALLSRPVPDLTAAALHLRAAGPAADPAQVAEVSMRAADHAARLYAWEAAVAHADTAAEILSTAPDHAAAGGAALHAGLIRLRASIGFPEAVRHLEAALVHYQADGDATAAAMVHSRLGGALSAHHSVMDIPRALEHFAAAERTLPSPDTVFHLRRGQAQAAMFGLRTGLLGTAAEQMEGRARASGQPELGVQAAWAQGWSYFNRGELARSEEYRESAWRTALDVGNPYASWGAVDAAALCATDYLLDPAAGRAWCRRGLVQPRFDTYAHPHAAVLDQLAVALAFMGDLGGARDAARRLPDDAVGRRLLLYLDGEWERAELAWATALAEDQVRGDRHDAAYNARWLAAARHRRGDDDGAVEALQHALALAIDGPQVPTEVHVRAELARMLAPAGDVAAASEHLARCEEILAAGEDWRGLVGVVALARAAVADMTGTDPAEGFTTAVEVFTTFQVPWRRAHALRAWAASLRRSGDRSAADNRREAALADYDRIGAAARWQRAD